MSYRLDLDEQDERKLVGEIERRKALRAKGLCDYCERTPDTKPCKFPGRHRRAQEEKTDENLS
jgi:hypothetical protein